jgi:hypothetical protein
LILVLVYSPGTQLDAFPQPESSTHSRDKKENPSASVFWFSLTLPPLCYFLAVSMPEMQRAFRGNARCLLLDVIILRSGNIDCAGAGESPIRLKSEHKECRAILNLTTNWPPEGVIE